MKFNDLIPELSVSDIQKSLEFYTKVLGFAVEYQRPQNKFVFLSRGGAQIMIEEINGNWNTGDLKQPFGRGINFQIETENIGELLQNIQKNNINLYKEPFVSEYASDNTIYVQKEFLIQDPDGYLLRFSETLS
jgi:catechol 2,3-dioxygenase-like lactoylglutathione lyase family enzyme